MRKIHHGVALHVEDLFELVRLSIETSSFKCSYIWYHEWSVKKNTNYPWANGWLNLAYLTATPNAKDKRTDYSETYFDRLSISKTRKGLRKHKCLVCMKETQHREENLINDNDPLLLSLGSRGKSFSRMFSLYGN